MTSASASAPLPPAPATAPAAGDGEALARLAEGARRWRSAVGARVLGQERVLDALLTALVAGGHALFIGPPGVAKTLLVRSAAQALGWSFRRIQFTPDLMPGDITGAEVLREVKATGERQLDFLPGPVFANLVLADEINRAPAKTQAALLEAMQEAQVTCGGRTHALPRPFAVLATQNPIEQEGTYRLPEAQLDRFLLAIRVDYPDAIAERAIALLGTGAPEPLAPAIDQAAFAAGAAAAARLPIPAVAVDYAVRLVRHTRPHEKGPEWVRESIAWGCGPRATQHLVAAARAWAALHGDTAATVAHVRTVAPLALGHRLVPSYAAAARGLSGDALVERLLGDVAP